VYQVKGVPGERGPLTIISAHFLIAGLIGDLVRAHENATGDSAVRGVLVLVW